MPALTERLLVRAVRSFFSVQERHVLSHGPPSLPLQVFVVDPEPAVAQAIAALAVDALPAHAETIIAKSTTVVGAKRLLDRLRAEEEALVIVVCASALGDGRGLDVLSYARLCHPLTRVVLMTNGERDEFTAGVRTHVDGLVARPEALSSLRSILEHLGRSDGRRVPQQVGPDGAEFHHAVEAMARALEAVERAHHSLVSAADDTSVGARRVLAQAEVLAVEAHRRVLEAERRLRGATGAVPAPMRSES